MARPLRSLLIGDCSMYPSEFIFGVGQGMTLLGHWHSQVDIRSDIDVIAKRLNEVQPDIIWGHMLLWPPGGPHQAEALLDLCASWRVHGARVVIHDGDAKPQTRYQRDVSSAVDLALCNHTSPRQEWKVPCLRWPYFAFTQRAIAPRVQEFTCDLAFAGRLDERGIYAERTAAVIGLKHRLKDAMLVLPNHEHPHTLFRTPELAASANCVLGWARPDSPGWTDVRVFQYPGAGGILLHNGAEEWLTPFDHYVPFRGAVVDGVLEALDYVLMRPAWKLDQMRDAAFEYVQLQHSSVPRVRQVLRALDLGGES